MRERERERERKKLYSMVTISDWNEDDALALAPRSTYYNLILLPEVVRVNTKGSQHSVSSANLHGHTWFLLLRRFFFFASASAMAALAYMYTWVMSACNRCGARTVDNLAPVILPEKKAIAFARIRRVAYSFVCKVHMHTSAQTHTTHAHSLIEKILCRAHLSVIVNIIKLPQIERVLRAVHVLLLH
uniref:Uncharacterized protein n=1 Tax=Trichogramma kaykai TaxID=54128 RepID=A0ABD2WF49_9HYME